MKVDLYIKNANQLITSISKAPGFGNLKIIENAREHYIRFVEERLGCSREEAMYLDRMFHGNHDRAVFDFLDKYQITPKELYEAIRGIEVDHVPENPALRKQLDELPG